MKEIKKKLTIMVLPIIGLFLFYTLSAGSSGSSSNSPCKKCPPPIDCVTDNTQSMNIALVANSFTPLPTSIRRPEYPIPVSPNLWLGNISATSLSDNPYSKYYCKITVTNLECSTWSSGGSEGDGNNVVTWNGVNNNMMVKTPKKHKFRLKIEYFEPAGFFWNIIPGGFQRRGHWKHEVEMYPTPGINVFSWTFVGANQI